MKFLLLLIICILSLSVFSQKTNMTQEIDSVFINAEKVNKTSQDVVIDLNEEYVTPNTTLTRTLFKKSNIYIKEYGNGQLASISMKGFNAKHTDINWNGIKLNSPMLGQSDLNILSIGNNNTLTISNDNSNNLGGSINLEQDVDFKKEHQLNFSASVGSFASSAGNLSHKFSNKRVYNNILVSYQASKNNFRYTNPSIAGKLNSIQNNAETKLLNVENVFGYNLNSRNQVKVFGKYYSADRNIAPSLFETNSTENQKDQLALGKVSWHHKYLNLETDLNTAYVYQEINYRFSENSSVSSSYVNSWQTNFEMEAKFIDDFSYKGKLSHEYETGRSVEYTGIKKRNTTIIDNSILYDNGIFKSAIGFTEMLVDSKLSPFLPKAKIEFKLKDAPAHVVLGIDYAAKIRYPTLNDLYWNPGGNQDLIPESSQNIKFQMLIYKSLKKVDIQNKFEYYSIWAKNYIQWRPTSNGFWSPQNIGLIYSRGFNNELDISIHLKNEMAIDLGMNYSFTRIGKPKTIEQLIYVPYYQMNVNTGFKSKWINFDFNHRYTGERYAVAVNSQTLNAFYLLDFMAYKSFNLRNKDELTLGVNLNNITNQTYFSVLNRPVPGFNFNFTLKYTLDFKI